MAVARKKPGSKAKKKAAVKVGISKKPAASAKPKKKAAATKAKPKKKVTAKAKTKTVTTKAKSKKVAAKAKPSKAKPKKTAAKAKPKKPARAGTLGAKSPKARDRMPEPLPSERAIAVAAQRPEERALTDKEREAMTKIAQTALALLDAGTTPSADAVTIIRKIGAYVDAVRAGAMPEPKTDDERLGIGVLWGEQVRAQVGWRWVHLSYADGFASYALVPDDRAFACFPLNRLGELARQQSNGANTSVPLFDSIRAGALPQRRENAYLVIG